MTDSPATRKNGRAPVVLSGLALAVAVAGTGGPAIARAIAPNADKVDGFHAVGAKAGDAKRAKKLVATNGQGRLPDGAINPELAFPEEVPPGVTVRGVWSIIAEDGTPEQDNSWGTSFSFPAAMPAGLSEEVVYAGDASENCPGPSWEPTAVPGYLCVYVEADAGPQLTTGTISTDRYGAVMWVNDDNTAAEDILLHGVWAATAPLN